MFVRVTGVPIAQIVMKAPEAVSVIEAHREVFSIRRYESTLVPRAQALIGASQELEQLKMTEKSRLIERRDSFGAAQVQTSLWLITLGHEVPGFDPAEPVVDDDKAIAVLRNASHVIGLAQTWVASQPDAAEGLSTLESSYASAVESHQRLMAVRVQVQAKRGEVRSLASEVHRGLVSLRKTLRVVFGRMHVDYRRLLVDRSRAAAEPPVEVIDEDAPEPASGAPPSGSA